MPASDRWEIPGATVQVLVSSRTTGGRYTVCQVETSGCDGAPRHMHGYEDGFFYVLQGDFRFQIGSDEVDAPAGASLFVPRRTPYAFCSREGGRLLVLSHPGGMDLLFQDLGAALRAGISPNAVNLAPILEKHGITVSPEPQSR